MLLPKKYQIIIIAALLIFLSFVMVSYSVKRPRESGFFRKLVLAVVAPLEETVNTSIGELGNLWKRYIFLVGLEEENRNLKKKNAQLLARVIQYQEGYLEGQRLRKILDLREGIHYSTVVANVVGKNQLSAFRTILINKGTGQGLRVGLPVVSHQAVVGRIMETSWNVSKVLLITDENSNIDALVQGDRAQGILQGYGPTGCNLKYVHKMDDVRKGDAVLSSGLGGIFPKGLLLGVVTSISKKDADLFQKIEVAPSADFARLEEVVVFLTGKDEDR
jgi:rod shape-determining protein MreC